MKVKMMADKGLTLIGIPCWWKNEESLIATIQANKQELLENICLLFLQVL